MYITASGVPIPQGTDAFTPPTQFKGWADAASVTDNLYNVNLDSDRTSLAPPQLRDGIFCWVRTTKLLWAYQGTTWTLIYAPFIARVTRSSASPTIFSADYTDFSANGNWLTTGPAAQNVGFAAYSNGWTIPVTGTYRVGLTVMSVPGAGIGIAAGVTVNKSTGVTYTDLRAATSASNIAGLVALSTSQEIALTAGDVLRAYGIASSTNPVLAPNIGAFSVTWVCP